MKQVYLVSYPRSGNTWLRLLVANVLHPEIDCGYIDIDYMVPDIHQMRSWKMKKVIQYRTNIEVFKSHHISHPDYECVVYLYRDVRDVVISGYHFYSWSKKSNISFEKYFNLFVGGNVPFQSWQMHVRVWWKKAKANKSVYLVKYEDLLVNTQHVFGNIVKFMGLKVDNSIVRQAVERAVFDRCRKRAPVERVAPGKLGFRGTSGGWSEVLSEAQKERLWQWTGSLLKELGYKKEV